MLSAQGGFGLVEVMVSAALIVVIATATVTSIASSQKQSTRTLARSITSNLAEQDQERMKAMRTTDLVNYTATRSVLQENIAYQVDSKTEFVQGPNGSTVGCASTGEQTSYLRLRSTVTPQASLDADPLTVESFHPLPIAQFSPISGTLIAKVFEEDGTTPQPSITVSITGPESRTLDTNAQGCAVFQFLRPGAYSIRVNEPGFVDPSLRQDLTISGTVTASTINTATPIIYERAGSFTASVNTLGNTTSRAGGITFSNGGIPTPSFRRPTTLVNGGLFPFTSPYLVYSGMCDANDPTRYDANFATANPTFGRAFVTPSGSTNVLVMEPQLRTTVTLRNTNNNSFRNARLLIKQADSGCSLNFTQNVAFPAGTGNPLTHTAPVDLENLPFGNYRICAEVEKTSNTGSGNAPNGWFSQVFDYNAPTTPTVADPVPNTVYLPGSRSATVALDFSSTSDDFRSTTAGCSANAQWTAP